MVKISWTESALSDLEAIVRFIAKDSSVYARRTGMRLVQSARQLQQMPLMGRIVPELNDPSIREIIIHAYRIIYHLSGETCTILAVIHASRDIIQKLKNGADESGA